jgi:DNA-binding beta-propeller fold protein YncE
MKRLLFVGALLAVPFFAIAAEPRVETVLTGLTRPSGVAVQTGTGRVFVADSGTGQILRVVDSKAEVFLANAPRDGVGPGRKYALGRLGLAFLNWEKLLVGDGGQAHEKGCIRSYRIPINQGQLDYERDAAFQAGALAKQGDESAEGMLFGVVASKNAVYVTGLGDPSKGWIAKADLLDGKLGTLEPFIATQEVVQRGAPGGIAISPHGEIVVGQMGERNTPGDSLLNFFGPNSGKLLMKLETGLSDITGLAYHPQTGLLYAIDFAWSDPSAGGLFRLDRGVKAGDPPVQAIRVASLQRPTALAFANDGVLYVTTISPVSDTAAKSGTLLKITLP